MANLGSLGSLFVDLAANTATFESDMGRAARISEKRAKEIGKQFDEMGKRVGVALAATAAVVAAGVTKAIRDADELGKVAQKTAVSVESLSKLKFAASMEDVDFGSLETALIKFNKAQVEAVQGGKDQAAAFKAVGISLDDLKRLKPDELLLRVADAFAAAEGDASKTALVVALFGKSGADLIPLLNKGSAAIREQGEVLKRLGGVITNDLANAADNVGDNFDLAKTAVDGLFIKLATDLSPEIINLTKLIADEKFQNGVANLVRDVSDLTVTLIKAAPELFRIFAAFRGAAIGFAAGTPFGPIGQLIGTIAGATAGEFSPEIIRATAGGAAGGGVAPAQSGGDAGTRTKQMTALALSINAVQAKINSGDSFKAGTLEADARALETLTQQYRALAGPVEEAKKRSLGYSGAQEKAAKKTKEAKLELDDHAKALMENDERLAALGKTLTEQVLTPEERYAQQLAKLDEAYNNNVISAETRTRQLGRLADEYYAGVDQQEQNFQADLNARLELQERIRSQADRAIRNDPTSRAFGIGSLEELESRMDLMQSAALDMGDALNSAFSKAGGSLSEMITNMILFGDEGDISAKKIAAALIQDVVQGFVKVGIQMAANFALSKILGATSTGVALAEAASLSAAWAPAAAGASIATYGSAAAAGSAGLVTTYGLAESLAALSAFGLANGGPAHAGGLYEVGEMNRPELAYFQGKQYLIPGNQGGMVRPLDEGARSVSGGGGAAGMTVINKAPGLVLTRRGNELTIDMVPALAELISSKTIARARSEVRGGRGLGADVVAKTGTQGRPMRPRS